MKITFGYNPAKSLLSISNPDSVEGELNSAEIYEIIKQLKQVAKTSRGKAAETSGNDHTDGGRSVKKNFKCAENMHRNDESVAICCEVAKADKTRGKNS